jgi:lactate permease
VTLAGITGLPIDRLSAGVGRICAPLSLMVPAYLVLVMGGWKALRGVLPAAVVCGVAFAGTQFFVSNFVGPHLTDILASLAAIIALVVLFKVWKPSDKFSSAELDAHTTSGPHLLPKHHTSGELVKAWGPYVLLVIFVLLWGYLPFQAILNKQTISFGWPSLDKAIQIMPPVAAKATPYAAVYRFNWLAASGTSCLFAAILAALWVGMSPGKFIQVFLHTVKQLALAEMTIAAVMALAYLMNYSGATATLGLAFAATGAMFPFFSALLGWLGVFLTGSDTSANALFGNLQVVTATKLHMDTVLAAASNSSGGVMGKMISLTSIAVASSATAMVREDEAKLFRFTMRHSVLLASVIGLIVMFYAYVAPSLAP